MKILNLNERKVPISISFSPELLQRIERLRNQMTRSVYVTNILDEVMTKEEHKLGIVS